MRKYSILISACAAFFLHAGAEELKITADKIQGDRNTGAFRAEGSVKAEIKPFSLLSELVTKSDEKEYEFSSSTQVTTCTNAPGHRHWHASGSVVYRQGEYVKMNDAKLSLWELPVFWLPIWYYPINTDYGWRVSPGYTGRHGAYLYTKYVYSLAGSMAEGMYGLSGATRVDLRSKNGIAAGQSLNWSLGEYGRGKFKVYFADDADYDRYDRRWTSSRHWNYRNWGSTVDRERWAVMLTHSADLGPRDTFKVRATSFSDSHMEGDFLRNALFGGGNRFMTDKRHNEAAWEHLENRFAFGGGVSGPIDDFVGGLARLPEFYFDFMPTPVADTGINYESQSKIGYYNRSPARYGDASTDEVFRYAPGRWANYNTFRFDTYHRFSMPFKVADVLSVVPRAGVRGTYWGESGYIAPTGYERAGVTGDDVWRGIVEGGVTFSARGKGEVNESLRHVIEPYLDILAQECEYSGLDDGSRPYVFDGVEGSIDYLDQFAGRSRNLPYTWYGMTPGLRNVFRSVDENGSERTFLDIDVYAAVQFNDTSFYEGSRWQRLVRDVEDPNYGRGSGCVMPGAMVAWSPTESTMLAARGEYDTENDALAYADVTFAHKVNDRLSWYLQYNGRDHRVWDYAPMPYDGDVMRKDMFNHAREKYAEAGFEYEFCDALAFAPYAIWNVDENRFAEVGSWIDLRTDCLGFRFILSYENEIERVDRSVEKGDFRCGFYVYLRALGPGFGDFDGIK